MRRVFLAIACLTVLGGGLVSSGCGGSSDSTGGGGPTPLLFSGVFAGPLTTPGVGPGRVVLTVEARQGQTRGRLTAYPATGGRWRGALEEFAPDGDGFRFVVDLEELGAGRSQRVTGRVVPVGGTTPARVSLTVRDATDSNTATLPRDGDFIGNRALGTASAPQPPTGSYTMNWPDGGLDFTIVSATPDGQGGWNLQGRLEAGDYEAVFGNSSALPADLEGGSLFIVTWLGMLQSQPFVVGQGGTGTVRTLLGDEQAPITAGTSP